MSKWLNNIGRVIKAKSGNYFMVFERRKDKDGNPVGEDCFPLVFNEGDTLQLKLKKDDLQKLVDDGKMSQETADKICETVKFEVSRAPQDGSAQSQAKGNNSNAKTKVDF